MSECKYCDRVSPCYFVPGSDICTSPACKLLKEKDAEIAELKHERNLANKRFDEKCNEFMFGGLAQEKEIAKLKADLLTACDTAEFAFTFKHVSDERISEIKSIKQKHGLE